MGVGRDGRVIDLHLPTGRESLAFFSPIPSSTLADSGVDCGTCICSMRHPRLPRAPRMVQPSLASTKEAAQKTSWSSRGGCPTMQRCWARPRT